MRSWRNNFIFAPVKTGYSDETGEVTIRHIKFYQRRSRYVAAVTVEPLYMDKGLREIPTQMGIAYDEQVPGLQRLTDTIHGEGAQAVAHLNHPGRMVNPNIPRNYFVSSTGKACENGGAQPVRMDRAEMDRTIGLFQNAAQRAEQAGFDMIELQFGHGYLLAQFLSPAVNDRSDEYGGSFENRMRFPLEVLRAVQESSPLPVIARISGDEMLPDGIKVPEMLQFASVLHDEGVAALHVSSGTVCSTPPWFFQHMFVPKGKTWQLAADIRNGLREADVGLPVIFVGRVNSKADVDHLQQEMGAEYIAVGRELVADPDFVGKYLGIVKGAVRPCLACAEGCLGGVKSGKGLQCVVNPLAGRESEGDFEEEFVAPDAAKKYAVVGGGPAGMQAALTLKQRGHQVELFEKERLGGQFSLAALPPNKQGLNELINYYRGQIEANHIPVHCEEATTQKIESGGFDGALIATGAEPVVPPIKGLKKYSWTEFLHDDHLPERTRVLIIGGGLIGMELASKLVDRENHVIVVEMLPEVANGMEMIEKKLTMKKLKDRGVEIFTHYKVAEVDGAQVRIEPTGDSEEAQNGTRQLEDIDHIVVTAGMRSNRRLQEALSAALNGSFDTYLIGDAKKVGKAQTAILDAYVTALQI